MSDYARVTLTGSLPGGEVWSVNPVYELFGNPTVSPAQAAATAAAINAINPGNALLNGISSVGRLTGCRVEFRSASWDLEQVGEATRAAPLAGIGNPTKTHQSAVVLSLRSSFPGASNRGRLYWPALNTGMDTATLKITTAQRDALSTDATAYLAAISAAIGTAVSGSDPMLSVYSPTRGTARVVASIWVGDTFDIQRRRRDSLVESYAIAVYPPP